MLKVNENELKFSKKRRENEVIQCRNKNDSPLLPGTRQADRERANPDL